MQQKKDHVLLVFFIQILTCHAHHNPNPQLGLHKPIQLQLLLPERSSVPIPLQLQILLPEQCVLNWMGKKQEGLMLRVLMTRYFVKHL